MIQKIDYPHMVAVELPNDELINPFSGNIDSDLMENYLRKMFKGIIRKDGRIIELPGGWTCDKLDIGVYKITHGLGWKHVCISASLLVQPGSFNLEVEDTFFIIRSFLDSNTPIDAPFTFTLTYVLAHPKNVKDTKPDQGSFGLA